MAKKLNKTRSAFFWGVTRITLGFVFLWAFIDKMFGLGFATCRATDGVVTTMCEKAWIEGGSPTAGFLKFGTKGSPLEGMFQSMAGNALWDWLFMLGLLGIGVSLILGIATRIATYSGVALMAFMYAAVFQPANNPIIDDHVVYALVLLGLGSSNETQALSMRAWWEKQDIVRRYPILK